MKLSGDGCCDDITPEKWRCLDSCPVCQLLRKAVREGKDISPKEWEEAFSEAEEGSAG